MRIFRENGILEVGLLAAQDGMKLTKHPQQN